MIKLYGAGPSRWVKCYWTLRELDLAFEPVSVSVLKGETRTPDFLAKNPFGCRHRLRRVPFPPGSPVPRSPPAGEGAEFGATITSAMRVRHDARSVPGCVIPVRRARRFRGAWCGSLSRERSVRLAL